jgi:hypothetical protein
MAENINRSNTSRIFNENNFSRFLPIISNNEFLKQNSSSNKNTADIEAKSFLGKKLGKMSNLILGDQTSQIELQKISELIQSVSKFGLFTNEILKDVKNIKDIGDSIKITYISPKGLDEFFNSNAGFVNANANSKILNDKDIKDLFAKEDNINKLDELKGTQNTKNFTFKHTKDDNQKGLSTIQMLNPNLRACFKNSQEIDAFFNMISTLDMSMAIPYVKADLIIPESFSQQKMSNEGGDSKNLKSKKYITASLHNFLYGSEFASNEDNFTNNSHAINGSYKNDEYIYRAYKSNSPTSADGSNANQSNDNNTTSPASTSKIVQEKYIRQHMNNAIFFAPQTMVNADIDLNNTLGTISKDAIIDKFRPFMSILSLSFDVRPSKGLMFYKTASMELILYDKARMPEIAPFIKPELLNVHSSEIILEYGWQHNLGDSDIIPEDDITNRNPIAQFINSLKVREKYIIVNSSYNINENGTVTISLSLSMKGPTELRGTPMPQDVKLSELDAKLIQYTNFFKNEIFQQKFQGEETNAFGNLSSSLNKKIGPGNIDLEDIKTIRTQINETKKKNDSIEKTNQYQKIFSDIEIQLVEAEKVIKENQTAKTGFLNRNFSFLNEEDIFQKDPFVDKDWWNKNGFDVKNKYISLGCILTYITGKFILKHNTFNEIQLVFYNLNAKAIRASYLNIASIPVEVETFKKWIEKTLNRITKISVEELITLILKRCVNEKAADVYGLGNFFIYDQNDSAVFNTKKNRIDNDIDEDVKNRNRQEIDKAEQQQLNKSLKGEIFKQYYDFKINDGSTDDKSIKDRLDKEYQGIYDLTFNTPKVVMNFDSIYHENDKNISILRMHFYDNLDNPYESLTDVISSIQSGNISKALSSIHTYRVTKYSGKNSVATTDTTGNSNEPIQKSQLANEAKEIIEYLISEKIIKLMKTVNGVEQETNDLNDLSLSSIKINITDKLDKSNQFINLKQKFKSYMPSLTLGQTRSALLSGNITTNQDAKYSTALLSRQSGEVFTSPEQDIEVDLFSEGNDSPMFVIPSQASAQIIGCPLINFSQLIFLDFNTGTTVDNMYFVNGIKHSITPGKFSTDLTLVQNDLYSRYESQATSIAQFLINLRELNNKKEADALEKAANKDIELKRSQGNAESKTDDPVIIQNQEANILFDIYIQFENYSTST